MVTLRFIRHTVGFSLKGIGLFWSFADKFLCGTVCGDRCSQVQGQTCSFLFLFVGIIFIVCGYVLIVMKDKKRRKIINKFKHAIKMTN